MASLERKNVLTIAFVAPTEFGKTTFISMLCEDPNELLMLSSQKAENHGRTKCTIAYWFNPEHEGKAKIHVDENTVGIRFKDSPTIDDGITKDRQDEETKKARENREKLINSLKKIKIEVPDITEDDKTDIYTLEANIKQWAVSPQSNPSALMSITGIDKLIAMFIFDIKPNQKLCKRLGNEKQLIMVDTKGLFDIDVTDHVSLDKISKQTCADIGLSDIDAIILGYSEKLKQTNTELLYGKLLDDLICKVPTFIMGIDETNRSEAYSVLSRDGLGFAEKIDGQYQLKHSYFNEKYLEYGRRPWSDTLDDFNKNKERDPLDITKHDIQKLIRWSTRRIIKIMGCVETFYDLEDSVMSIPCRELWNKLTNSKIKSDVPWKINNGNFTDEYRFILDISRPLVDSIPEWIWDYPPECWDLIKGNSDMMGPSEGVTGFEHTKGLMYKSYYYYKMLVSKMNIDNQSSDELIEKFFGNTENSKLFKRVFKRVNKEKFAELIRMLYNNKLKGFYKTTHLVTVDHEHYFVDVRLSVKDPCYADRIAIIDITNHWRANNGFALTKDNPKEFITYLITRYVLLVLSNENFTLEDKQN